MELSLAEIRNFMLNNGCKVTNHALVKHFKEFLTNPDTQNEARKQFKTYVNILATIRTEDKRDGSNEKEKYLILKPKYLHECPSEDNISLASGTLMSPASRSISSEMDFSPSGRQPPPYRPPPDVSPGASGSGTPAKVAVLEPQTRVQYKDCINEYRTAIMALQRQPSLEAPVELRRSESQEDPPQVPPRKRSSAERSFSIEKSSSDDTVSESNKENVAIMEEMLEIAKTESENKISVKEATKKFNKIASEEEKIISPSSKKKPEKIIDAEINDQEALVSDPKAKEWLVSAARCNYQELSKLASDNPRLVKLRDPTTGYTALHWAAKHGNENVVKLIAGTYKANANAQTNGGYTPLHISMQFGRDNIFELLQNVYKVDRDILDWSGKKALDYRRQKTAVSASTYSSKYYPVSPTASVFSFGFDDPPDQSHYRSTVPLRRHPPKGQKAQKYFTEGAPASSSVQRSASVLVQRLEHQAPEADGDNMSLFSADGTAESEMGGRRRGKVNKSFLRKKFGSQGKRKRNY